MKNMEKLGIIFSALLLIITFFSLQAGFLNSQRTPSVNETTFSPPPITNLTNHYTVLPTTEKNRVVSLTTTNTVFTQEEIAFPGKTVKDSELWFTIRVPESWVVTTERISNPEGYEGLVYITRLYNENEFSIMTYAISQSQDQDLRNYFRKTLKPYPNESTVVINGITYTRFESKSVGQMKVAYVVSKGSANERGYASVIVYSLSTTGEYQQKDFESVISSFHYLQAKDITSAKGEEIQK